ncbi:MAG: BatA and WFA domain-containing protein [Bacteroidia bacterium]|nr:BatA and WFA domain-containing protein [Bacteroidia bacterium]MDW8347959.1 BatA and WFA domain-containing protein [Bacteroidia bacterium]
MFFLNSAALWGLLAVLIPILIHLINLRRPRKILFSNVSFLQQIEQVQKRSTQIKQWLILITRILAIGCLVLAFANPVWKNRSSYPIQVRSLATDNTSNVIILDNSMSMQAQDENGTWFNYAKNYVQILLSHEIIGDEYCLLTFDNAKYSQTFVRSQKIKEILPQIQLTSSVYTLQDIIARANILLGQARYARKRVYVISDFQKSTFGDSVQKSGTGQVPTYFIPVAKNAPANLTIENVEILTQIIEINKPISLKTSIKNYGDKKFNEQTITLQIDGKTVGSQSFSIGANTKQEINFNFTIRESGWHQGLLLLNDYPITFDNQRYFSFYVPEGKKILLIKGNDEEIEYLKAAFESIQSKKNFILDVRQENEASTLNFEEYDGIFLVGVQHFSTGLIQNFKSYVLSGRGIVFFPSKNADQNEYNAFAKTLGEGSFANMEHKTQKFQDFDLQDPLFTNVFEKDKQGKIESPEIKQYLSFVASSQSIHNKIISLGDGKSFLSEVKVKQNEIKGGKVYYFAVGPNLSWGDFVLHNTFAPLIYRTALSIAGSVQYEGFYLIGENVDLEIITQDKKTPLLLKNGNVEISPAQEPINNGIRIHIEDNVNTAGNYQLIQGKKIIRYVSFNYPDAESNLSHYHVEELESMLQAYQWKNTFLLKGTTKTLAQTLKDAQQGRQLWRLFIILSLIFLLIEILLLKFYKVKIVA